MSAPRLVLAQAAKTELFGQAFESIFSARRKEAERVLRDAGSKGIRRMLAVFSASIRRLTLVKQFYHFDVRTWLEGDPAGPGTPESRKKGRQSGVVQSLQPQTLSPSGQGGSIPGTPLGILRSTAFLSRKSIRTSPRNN